MNIKYFRNNDKEILFYGVKIIELMDLELKDIQIDGELIINDSIPLITKEDIMYIYNLSKKNESNVILKFDNKEVGRYLNGYNKSINYESSDFAILNDSSNYEELFKEYNKRVIIKHKNNGVYFTSSESVIISPFVNIEEGTYIFNGVILLGHCSIGKNNIIGPYSSLENFICGCYNKISWFVGKDSSIGDNNVIGPFSHFREKVSIENDNVIGNFNELKSSNMGSSNRMKHLSYLGNTEVNDRVNFGCGVITANYDGKKKHKTEIGSDVFIGCNSVLIAPLKIENNAFIAAHSNIYEDLGEYDFAISRSKQTTKKQYMKK